MEREVRRAAPCRIPRAGKHLEAACTLACLRKNTVAKAKPSAVHGIRDSHSTETTRISEIPRPDSSHPAEQRQADAAVPVIELE